MSASSSDDLHPLRGARFVFEREDDSPPRYRLRVYLPAAELRESTLSWDGERARFEPPLPAGWAADEAAKLARVLHRTRATRLMRWRGP